MDTGLENSVFMARGRGVDSGALAMHQWDHNDRGQHIQYRKNSAEQEGIDLSATMGRPLQFCWKYLKFWGFLITVPLAKLDKGRGTERGRREKENGQALDCPSPTPICFFCEGLLTF